MPKPAIRPDRVRQALLAACVVLGAGLVILFCLEKFGVAIPCVFRAVTGLYCPGCGATRGLAAFLRLDFYQAVRFNLLLPLFLPYLTAVSLRALAAYLRGTGLRQNPLDSAICTVLLVLCIAFGVARNLPYFAFLAPTPLV